MYREFGVNEEGMVANPPGGSGGFGGQSNPAGPTAGYDQPIKIDGRNKFVRKYISKLMNDRQKRKERKDKKAAQAYNPYFTPPEK
jgi:hypothetical protein